MRHLLSAILAVLSCLGVRECAGEIRAADRFCWKKHHSVIREPSNIDLSVKSMLQIYILQYHSDSNLKSETKRLNGLLKK